MNCYDLDNLMLIFIKKFHSFLIKNKKKILIFEKQKVWKSFIEMANLEDAKKAKNGLDNYVLY